MRGKEVQGLLQDLVGGITPAYAGKVDVVHLPVVFRGITPACAGKSTQYFPACSCIWDHPRVCGEKLSTTSTDIHPAGSPSRVRGKADFPVRCREHSRITPACVGKRRKPCRRHAANRDHPRVCGKKFHPASDRKLGRVRGTKRSSGPAPAAAPAGLAGSCPAFPPWSYPPRITVSRPRP